MVPLFSFHFHCLAMFLSVIVSLFLMDILTCNSYDVTLSTSFTFARSTSYLESINLLSMRERYIQSLDVLTSSRNHHWHGKQFELALQSHKVPSTIPSPTQRFSKQRPQTMKVNENESPQNTTCGMYIPHTLAVDRSLWKSWFVGMSKKVLQAMMVDPPLFDDYLNGVAPLQRVHEEKVVSIWKKARRKGSLKRLRHDREELFLEALRLSYVALWGQCNSRSLEVSIRNAAGIAAVLSEMKLDEDIILAGILQPIVQNILSVERDKQIKEFHTSNLKESESNTEKVLVKLFGSSSIALAKSYAKLPDLKAPPNAEYSPQQAENQILLLTVLTEHYHCLYIRIAERVHTMRVILELPLNELEKRKYAEEVLNIYAPLAHRMNLLEFKTELEDHSFQILDPLSFNDVKSVRAESTKIDELKMKIKAKLETDTVLNEHRASFLLPARIKSYYQIYLKQTRKRYFDPRQVRDVLGMQVIIDYPRKKKEPMEQYRERGNMLCYHVADRLSEIEDWYVIENGRKDYILGCKSNGYASLHQYVAHDNSNAGGLSEASDAQNEGVNNRRDRVVIVEIQIKTKKMHFDAKLGTAAHWYYKDLQYRPVVARSWPYRMAWRSAAQLQSPSHAHMIGLAKLQLAASRVLVLLNDISTVINLKKGCTALDAAFAIHLLKGTTTTEVKINGQVVPFSTILQNGDIVEIKLTDDGSSSAERMWLQMVKSPYAIATLKQHFTTDLKVS